MDFLDYAYLQSGQEAKAKDLLKAVSVSSGRECRDD